MIKQKKQNKDAMKHKKVLDLNNKDHDDLVVIANLPVLEKVMLTSTMQL